MSETKAKVVLELRRLGHKPSEIVKMLGLTRGQVAGIIHRAQKAALKRGLVDERSDSR